jgi:hypothetical protein
LRRSLVVALGFMRWRAVSNVTHDGWVMTQRHPDHDLAAELAAWR